MWQVIYLLMSMFRRKETLKSPARGNEEEVCYNELDNRARHILNNMENPCDIPGNDARKFRKKNYSPCSFFKNTLIKIRNTVMTYICVFDLSRKSTDSLIFQMRKILQLLKAGEEDEECVFMEEGNGPWKVGGVATPAIVTEERECLNRRFRSQAKFRKVLNGNNMHDLRNRNDLLQVNTKRRGSEGEILKQQTPPGPKWMSPNQSLNKKDKNIGDSMCRWTAQVDADSQGHDWIPSTYFGISESKTTNECSAGYLTKRKLNNQTVGTESIEVASKRSHKWMSPNQSLNIEDQDVGDSMCRWTAQVDADSQGYDWKPATSFGISESKTINEGSAGYLTKRKLNNQTVGNESVEAKSKSSELRNDRCDSLRWKFNAPRLDCLVGENGKPPRVIHV